ncbi:MAG: exo-beta-N-acetylmuramidase NamZ domain-containing protein [Desulfobacteraceae bacterium]|jgi:uncharacterized protein YbbC (DUF1343 family)
MSVKTGLEVLKYKNSHLKTKKAGLLANPASIDRNFVHAKKITSDIFGSNLKSLFSPQHGFFAEKQDNMKLSDSFTDPELKIPVYSLYGKTLRPDPEMFEDTDVLLIDIQDVGTRVYTFIYTISYCLEAASENNVKVVILDRPNPVSGSRVEGNILEPEYSSFVGRYPIPMRHGLTCGEFALFINSEFKINADLEVIKMEGFRREMYFEDTGLPWILPSPNLPVPASSYVYPGQVIFEGTNVSEGRGTAKPFEFFGAPYIEPSKLRDFLLKKYDLKGVHLREVTFQPTSNKWMEKPCRGFQIHITDKEAYRPYFLSLCILQGISVLFEKDFQLSEPPYEFEYEKKPLDLILGSKNLREKITGDENLYKVEEEYNEETEIYKKKIKNFLLY